MKTRKTNESIKKEIKGHISSLLSNGQTIPLSMESSYVEGVGDVSKGFIGKEGNLYVWYVLKQESESYQTVTINKKVAFQKIERQFLGLNNQQLQEELDYWKECAIFFENEEEEKQFSL